MKKRLLSILCFLSLNLYAQQAPFNCGFDAELAKQRLQPGFLQMEEQINNTIFQNPNNRGGGTLIIPVVVHIIHNNGPENISDAQVLHGIAQLNADFDAINGLNTNIQFCIAQQDPFGNATTGINRVVSALTVMDKDVDDLTIKDLSRWDPTQYMNIWLVASISSSSSGPAVVGYAYYPTSHGTNGDGLVCEAAYFGSTGPYTSVVATHEIGHYLGLYHTFESGCSNANCQVDGDKVCDTPPDNSTAVYACNTPPNSCFTDDDDISINNPFRPIGNGGLGDQPDDIQNHMDYGDLACHIHFTQGQADRMYTALTTLRSSLLTSIGCQSTCLNPINIAIAATADTILINGSITFSIPNANAGYTWTINNGAPITGNTITNTFSNTGVFTVTVTGTNGQNECDATGSMVVVVECDAAAHYTITPTGPYAPGVIITANNTSTNATTYQWFIDGALQPATTNLAHQFDQGGGHNIYLIATNNHCSDTSATTFLTVGDCAVSGYTNNWYFPWHAMNFSTSPPTLTNTGTLANCFNICRESTATMSDINGNLMFYSGGDTLWDRNNNVMPNGTGLLGNPSSTQESLAVPFPGHPTMYYLFTTPDGSTSPIGANYNIIDMDLNNGMGDVIDTAKNIFIRNDVGEKLTGVFHANGRDIWIGMANRTTNTYYVYLLTPAGLDTTPVVSVLGNSTNITGVGAMKFSHDGHTVAIDQSHSRTWVANFNNQTGVISGGYQLYLPNTNGTVHAYEFSPDNSKLYVSYWVGNPPYDIIQFDLAAGSPAQVAASRTAVDIYQPVMSYSGLCLGNDGKIYVGLNSPPGGIDCINNPNAAGVACNYTHSGPEFYLFALPNLLSGTMAPYSVKINGPANLCAPGQPYTYTVPYSPGTDSVVWSYNGLGVFSAVGNTATLTSPTVSSTAILSVAAYTRCGIARDTLVIQALPMEHFLGNDTLVCNTLTLSALFPLTHYLWNTNDTTADITVNLPGTYWLQATNSSGCSGRDTIVITPYPQITPVAITANPPQLCNGATTILNTGPGYTSYNWTDNRVENTYTAYQPGTYWVTVSNGCSTDRDSITIPSVPFNNPVAITANVGSICNGVQATLDAGNGYITYLWNDNSTNQIFVAQQPGTYWVTVTDNNGCSDTDSIEIPGGVLLPFQLLYNNDSIACKNELPFVLNAPAGYTQYSWQDASTAQSYNVGTIGSYWVTVTDSSGCTAVDTFRVEDCTGIDEEIANGIRIYPNPANDLLYIETASTKSSVVKVYTTAGQMLLSNQFNSKVQLPINQLPNGLYIIELNDNTTVMRKKFLVMH